MNIGFLGGGKMAEAILSDIIKTGTAPAGSLFVRDISSERCQLMREHYGVNIAADNQQLLAEADIIFLAVKPQMMDELLKKIAPLAAPKHLFISIAAGKRTNGIEKLLPKARIIRVMPNMAAFVSEGMSVFCCGSLATDEDRATAHSLLACFGKVSEMPEDKFDAVTALSGSGPAFCAYFSEAMAEAGTKLGLNADQAALMAAQTMLGTAKLLVQADFTTESLIKSISSAKGTTVAGMDVIKTSNLKEIVLDTLSAAAQRSKELSA